MSISTVSVKYEILQRILKEALGVIVLKRNVMLDS